MCSHPPRQRKPFLRAVGEGKEEGMIGEVIFMDQTKEEY